MCSSDLMTLWVGQYTAVFMGCDGSHRTGVAVCAGRGMVCQKPTLGIPVENTRFGGTPDTVTQPNCTNIR